jgi:phage shock protein C
MSEKRKLYRSQEERMIAGVCGGLAEYFDLDPTIVRIGWVIFILAGGAGVLAYILMAIIVPTKPYELRNCSNCGEPIEARSEFCRNCGNKI